MNTYFLNLWDTVRSSYWFVPSLFVAGAVILSFAAPRIDISIGESGIQLPEWILTTTGAARATLSALAGAIMAVTGTVFSITIVTLSLTSQQFGPRLLRRFMYDLPTQVTLGVLVATGLYCLLVLRVVENRDNGLAAPHLSVFASTIMAMVSMAMLIFFIHHIAMLIQAPHVVATVAHDLDDAIDRLFPAKIGESPNDGQMPGENHELHLGDGCLTINSIIEGYIQAIDAETLLHLAVDRNVVLRLCAKPGTFIEVGSPLAQVWQASEDGASEEDLTEPLNETVIVGIRRTPRQDVECAIDELVEVAIRSLSPGINDPFTAMNCIDRLGAALGRLAERKLPSAYRHDSEGRLRVIAHPLTFNTTMDAAFNQIRQFGSNSVAVTLRLLEALESIAGHVRRREEGDVIRVHAEMIARLGDAFSEQHDRQEVEKRLASVKNRLDQS